MKEHLNEVALAALKAWTPERIEALTRGMMAGDDGGHSVLVYGKLLHLIEVASCHEGIKITEAATATLRAT